MININEETKKLLLKTYEKHGIGLEGNILKIINISEEESEFSDYIKTCKREDKSKRQKRLEVTKKVQSQNIELQKAKKENERVNVELKKIATNYGIYYFDISKLICNYEESVCDFITKNNEKIIFDDFHYTIEGAKYIGRKIFKLGWLDEISSIN